MALALSASGCTDRAPIAADLPVYSLHEDLRIVSNDSSTVTRFSAISPASFLLPDGKLFAIDSRESLVRIYDSTGNLIRYFGGEGDGPGEFRRPVSGGYTGDTIWIWEQGGRYQYFDSTLKQIGSAPTPRQGGLNLGVVSGGGIAKISNDTLYIRSGTGDVLSALAVMLVDRSLGVKGTLEGQEITMPAPYAPRAEPARLPGGRRILLLEPAEMWGGKPGELSLSAISLPDGARSERLIVPLQAQKLEAAAVDSAVQQGAQRWKTMDPSLEKAYREKAARPSHAPAFRGLAFASDKELWLSRYLDAGMLTVISVDGKPLRQVRIPDGVTLFAARGDAVWGIASDADGVQSLVRYRLRPEE